MNIVEERTPHWSPMSPTYCDMPKQLELCVKALKEEKIYPLRTTRPLSMNWSFFLAAKFPNSETSTSVSPDQVNLIIDEADFLIFNFTFNRSSISEKILTVLRDREEKPVIVKTTPLISISNPEIVETLGAVENSVAYDISNFDSEDLLELVPLISRYENIYPICI